MNEKVTISVEEYRYLLMCSVKVGIIENHAKSTDFMHDSFVRDVLGIKKEGE